MKQSKPILRKNQIKKILKNKINELAKATHEASPTHLEPDHPCIHGRYSWKSCPHCLGVNSMTATDLVKPKEIKQCNTCLNDITNHPCGICPPPDHFPQSVNMVKDLKGSAFRIGYDKGYDAGEIELKEKILKWIEKEDPLSVVDVKEYIKKI